MLCHSLRISRLIIYQCDMYIKLPLSNNRNLTNLFYIQLVYHMKWFYYNLTISRKYFVSKQTVANHLDHIYWCRIYHYLMNLKSWLNLNILDLFSITINWFYIMFFDFKLILDFTSWRDFCWWCYHDVVGATFNINIGPSYTIEYNRQKYSNYETKP